MMLDADAVPGHMRLSLGLHRAAGTRGPANNRVHTAYCQDVLHPALGSSNMTSVVTQSDPVVPPAAWWRRPWQSSKAEAFTQWERGSTTTPAVPCRYDCACNRLLPSACPDAVCCVTGALSRLSKIACRAKGVVLCFISTRLRGLTLHSSISCRCSGRPQLPGEHASSEGQRLMAMMSADVYARMCLLA